MEVPWKIRLWQNNMVMVHAERNDGEDQIPELQGQISEELIAKLQAAANPHVTMWYISDWFSDYGDTEVGEIDWVDTARKRIAAMLEAARQASEMYDIPMHMLISSGDEDK